MLNEQKCIFEKDKNVKNRIFYNNISVLLKYGLFTFLEVPSVNLHCLKMQCSINSVP